MRNQWTQYGIDHLVEKKEGDYLIVAMFSRTIGYVEPVAYGIFRERKGGTEREFLSNLTVTTKSPKEVVLEKIKQRVKSMLENKTGGQS